MTQHPTVKNRTRLDYMSHNRRYDLHMIKPIRTAITAASADARADITAAATAVRTAAGVATVALGIVALVAVAALLIATSRGSR